METTITKGIRISVEVFYQPSHSETVDSHVFAYRISIENQNDFAVQLLRRHWHIVHADGSSREVEGAGVVGKQPVLKPRAVHQYVSGCYLPTELGKMYGTYLMEKVEDGTQFRVRIPAFIMVVPSLLN